MTNLEYYKERILKLPEITKGDWSYDFSVTKNNEIAPCSPIQCQYCIFEDCKNCAFKKIQWLSEEYQPSIYLDDFEIEYLLRLSNAGYTHIARDQSGYVYTYPVKPKKDVEYWVNEQGGKALLLPSIVIDLPFIKWEDKEPWAIEDIVKINHFKKEDKYEN